MRKWVLEVFFLILLAGLTIAFFRVVSPFLLDIVFAMLFASMSWPLFSVVRRRLGLGKGLAAALTVLADFLMVVVPLSALATVFSIRTLGGLRDAVGRWPRTIRSISAGDVIAWLESLPLLGSMAQLLEADLEQAIRDLAEIGSRMAAQFASRSVSSVSGLLLHLFILLLLMFFLLRDGEGLQSRIGGFLPLSDREVGELVSDLRNTAAGTLISTLVIGLMEGTLGGVLFVVFGLPSPLLFAMLITILSIIPLIGTNVVLVPAGVVQIFQGNTLAGVVIIVVGLVGVAITQNVIKPRLLGSRSGLHPALALLSILGGIAWLGIVGFVIGPLLVSLSLVMWNQFAKRYQSALAARNTNGEDQL
jgi:predicted PurR-regulated permease PerM